jgi:hypothetical protein
MSRRLLVIVTAALALLGFAVPSGAQAAAPRPWTVSHGTASAEGIARYERVDFLSGRLILEGTNTNRGSGCYYVRLTVSHDLVPRSYESGEVCGTGSVPVGFSVGVRSITWSATVYLCRRAAQLDCGAGAPVSVYS